jgi:hypothetical protein
MRQLAECLDDRRKDVVVRAANLDGEAGAQLLKQVVTRSDLVVGADTCGEVTLQTRTCKAAWPSSAIATIRAEPLRTPFMSIISATPTTSGQASISRISARSKLAPETSMAGAEGTDEGAWMRQRSGRSRLASVA